MLVRPNSSLMETRISALTNSDLLPSHGAIPRNIHERLRAVLEIRLTSLRISIRVTIHNTNNWKGRTPTHNFLQVRLLLQRLDRMRRVFLAPTFIQLAFPSLWDPPCFQNSISLPISAPHHTGARSQTHHSVNSSPGNTALTLTTGPCVAAKHLMSCNCAALVTEYGKLLPPALIPAIEDVMMKLPPSGLLLKTGSAVRRR
jgi:hypothetical protein